MAELVAVIGVVASVVSIAAEGINLSDYLNNYVKSVKYADKEIQGVADDVRDTAIVLQQLGENLKLEKTTMICKPEFYAGASRDVEGCNKVFKEIKSTLVQSMETDEQENGGVRISEMKRRERFKWPFKRARVSLMRGDLDRLKAELSLKMSVMRHARDLHEQEVIDRDRTIGIRIDALKIKTLELETQAAEQRYQSLKRKVDVAKDKFPPDLPPPSGDGSFNNADDEIREADIVAALHQSEGSLFPDHTTKSVTLNSKSRSAEDLLFDSSTLGSGPSQFLNAHAGTRNEHSFNWSKVEATLVRIAETQEVLAKRSASRQDDRAESPTDGLEVGEKIEEEATEEGLDGSSGIVREPSREISSKWGKRSQRSLPTKASIRHHRAEQSRPAVESDATFSDPSSVSSFVVSIRNSRDQRDWPTKGAEPLKLEARDSGIAGPTRSAPELPSGRMLAPKAPQKDDNRGEHSDTDDEADLPPLANSDTGEVAPPELTPGDVASTAATQVRSLPLRRASTPALVHHDIAGKPQQPTVAEANEEAPIVPNNDEEKVPTPISQDFSTDIVTKKMVAAQYLKTLKAVFKPALIKTRNERMSQDFAENGPSRATVPETPRNPDTISTTTKLHESNPKTTSKTPPQYATVADEDPKVAGQQKPSTFTGGPSYNTSAAPYDSDLRIGNFHARGPAYHPKEDHLPILEAWIIRKADLSGKSKSWICVTMTMMSIDSIDLQSLVVKQKKSKKSIWDRYGLLSTYQQQQIQRLIMSRSMVQAGKRFDWSLKVLETGPERAKGVKINSIRVVIQRSILEFMIGNDPGTAFLPNQNVHRPFRGQSRDPPVPSNHGSHSRHQKPYLPSDTRYHPSPPGPSNNRIPRDERRPHRPVQIVEDPGDIPVTRPSRFYSDADSESSSLSVTSYDDKKTEDRISGSRGSRGKVSFASNSTNYNSQSQGGSAYRGGKKLTMNRHTNHVVDELEGSVFDLEEEVDGMSSRMDALEKQIVLARNSRGSASDGKKTKLGKDKFSSVSGPYYSSVRYSPHLPPSTSRTDTSLEPEPTVANLLSRWTIIDKLHDESKKDSESKVQDIASENKRPAHTSQSLRPPEHRRSGARSGPEIDDMD